MRCRVYDCLRLPVCCSLSTVSKAGVLCQEMQKNFFVLHTQRKHNLSAVNLQLNCFITWRHWVTTVSSQAALTKLHVKGQVLTAMKRATCAIPDRKTLETILHCLRTRRSMAVTGILRRQALMLHFRLPSILWWEFRKALLGKPKTSSHSEQHEWHQCYGRFVCRFSLWADVLFWYNDAMSFVNETDLAHSFNATCPKFTLCLWPGIWSICVLVL